MARTPIGTDNRLLLVGVGDLVKFVGGCVVFGGFVVLGYQGLLWLRTGEATLISNIDGLLRLGIVDPDALGAITSAIEGIEWKGVQSIVSYVVGGLSGFPACLSLMAVGALIMGIGTRIADRAAR